MYYKRSNLTTIKKCARFWTCSTEEKYDLDFFLWCDSQTSYLFFFSNQKATAKMRTPRMQAIAKETTKPRKRGKARTTVNIIALSGEGESLVCHNICILHLQPFYSLVTPLCDYEWVTLHRCSLECPNPIAASTVHSAVTWDTCLSQNASVEALAQQVIAVVWFLCYNKLDIVNKPK